MTITQDAKKIEKKIKSNRFKMGDMIRSKTGRGRPSFKIVGQNSKGFDIYDMLSTEFGTFTPKELNKQFTLMRKK